MTKFITKKGQGMGIDFMIGTAIFILVLGISIYPIASSHSKKSAFSEQIKNSAFSSSQKLAQKLSWSVYKTPILVNSKQNVVNQKLGFKINFSGIDWNSILLLKNGSLIPYDKKNNSILFEANLSKGRNFFELIYTKNTSLDFISPSPGFNTSNKSEFFLYPLLLLSELEYTGLSEEKINLYNTKSYEELQKLLGLGSLNFNISIPGYFKKGLPIPENEETFIVERPIKILDRFGTFHKNKVVVALW